MNSLRYFVQQSTHVSRKTCTFFRNWWRFTRRIPKKSHRPTGHWSVSTIWCMLGNLDEMHRIIIINTYCRVVGIATELRAGWSGDRIPVLAHPSSSTMGTGSLPGVKCGRSVTLTPHPLLVPRSKQSRAKPLLSLRSFVAYEMAKPTNTYCYVMGETLGLRWTVHDG